MLDARTNKGKRTITVSIDGLAARLSEVVHFAAAIVVVLRLAVFNVFCLFLRVNLFGMYLYVRM